MQVPTAVRGNASGRMHYHHSKGKDRNMLETIAIILLALWVLGMVSSYTIGGLIHILLVVAIVIFLVRVIQGRRPAV